MNSLDLLSTLTLCHSQMHQLPPPKTDTGLDLTEDGCGFANDQHFLTTVNAYFFASELGDTS